MPFIAPALPWLIGLGSAAGSIAANRASGRQADTLANQRQDQNAMEAARLNLQAPADRASNAVQGDILSNAHDFHFNPGFGTGSTGGLRPSIFSPQTRQLGALQSAQALSGAQTNNGNVAGVTPVEQPNWLDKVLGVAGTIGGLGAGITDARDLQSSLPYATAKKPLPGIDLPNFPKRLPGTDLPTNDWRLG